MTPRTRLAAAALAVASFGAGSLVATNATAQPGPSQEVDASIDQLWTNRVAALDAAVDAHRRSASNATVLGTADRFEDWLNRDLDPADLP